MEGKLCIVCCLLVTVLIVQVTGQSCPSYFSTTRGNCPEQRCYRDADCSGKICCRLSYCGTRCVMPEQDDTPRSPNETPENTPKPVHSETGNQIQGNQQIVHAGRCNSARFINCGGKLLCNSDGQCNSTEKCCRGNCGQDVCAGSLRSSVFSIFQGK